MARPKLILFCQLFYPELVSSGQTMTELGEELQKLGADVSVYCGPPTLIDQKTKVPKTMTYKGIQIQRLWSTRFSKLHFFGKLFNHLSFSLSTFFYLLKNRKDRTPLLVLTNPPFLPIIFGIGKVLFNRPYKVTVFDVYPQTAISLNVLKKNGLIAKFWEYWDRFSLNKAEDVVVLGRCMKKIIEKKLTRQNQSKLKQIHIWADDQAIMKYQAKTNKFKSLWKTSEKFIVLYSGNMGRFHDMETIMAAAKNLQEEKEILFLFVGDGAKKKSSQAFAAEHNLQNCLFKNYVNRDDLPELLHLPDIGFVSLLENQVGLSVPSKTFGLMAAGIPVLGILPSHSEIAIMIDEEKFGTVIKPGDTNALTQAILTHKNNKSSLKKMGQAGAAAITSKYSLHHAGINYLSLLTKTNS